jgi:hypothetical protein
MHSTKNATIRSCVIVNWDLNNKYHMLENTQNCLINSFESAGMDHIITIHSEMGLFPAITPA